MGKAVKSSITKKGKADEKNSGQLDPLSNIAEIAFDMELQIQDAIGIVRTAHDRLGEFEEGDPREALCMIWFRLEQIREGHALIAKNAPRRRCVLSEKGEMS